MPLSYYQVNRTQMTRILQILNEKNFYTTKYTKKHEGFIFILRDLPGCAGGFAEASRDLRGKNMTNRSARILKYDYV